MQIKRLVIENFKSIERIELIEPNPFTVFVGPNGSGKSNIFEALEFVNLNRRGYEARSLFGGPENYLRMQRHSDRFDYRIEFNEATLRDTFAEGVSALRVLSELDDLPFGDKEEQADLFKHRAPETYNQLIIQFSRLFIKNDSLVKLRLNDDQRLALDASNLEKVLKRVLSQDTLRNEIFEWLELFVPEFKSVGIVTNQFDGTDTLLWYEQYSEKPFTKNLISDGTYNILALLTAVYQSEEPQFLCIEEPENGLHPQVAGELIDFFRIICEERGHHIWLNTHSQSMIARLKPEEMVIVDKKQGATRIKQISKEDFKNWRMDEALLMNAFGGGLPW